MPSDRHTIIYTHTDEAPALATRSLLPVVNAFTDVAGVQVELRDISLAGRVLAAFPEALTADQQVNDDLAELGALVNRPEANVIKLPNVSASIPQLKATIEELRANGFMLPDYPDEPATPEEIDVKARYDKVKGSAVNPVLRQGNSDRRAPLSVKNYARSHPHTMGAWSPDSKTHVSTMGANDFRTNEQSVTFAAADDLSVELVARDGSVTVLKESIPVLAGEIVDATFMSVRALDAFLAEQMADAQAKDVLFSIHLKATMMKVSDPILFGHAVTTYFADVFAKYGDTFDRIGVNANDGLADVLTRVAGLPDAERAAIEADITAALASGAALAMVDSDRGITNLHVPSDIIIDASMPPMIRDSGKMWNAAGELQDTKAVIPDSSYAGVYAAVVDDCRAHGAFDPATMGSVPNVGLMAQQAEEYGSHDKTFEIPVDGTVRVVNRGGDVVMQHEVEAGDVWRACQVKDAPVRDWVGLAVRRARLSGTPIVFWLDETRAHDAQIIAKVRQYLPEHDTSGLTIEIMAPADACTYSLERIRRGEDTISVTGNVLARLPHRPLPDHGARHQRQDALHRAAHERRWPVRDGGRRVGAEARAAVREGEPPALGLARRIPRAGGVARVPRAGHRQRDRAAARRHARPRDRLGLERAQVAGAQGARARQPRQSLLPGALLGPGAGEAVRRRRPRGQVRADRGSPRRQRGADRARAQRGAGCAGRHRRLLPPRRRTGDRGHAPERHVQRHHRRHLTDLSPSLASARSVPTGETGGAGSRPRSPDLSR